MSSYPGTHIQDRRTAELASHAFVDVKGMFPEAKTPQELLSCIDTHIAELQTDFDNMDSEFSVEAKREMVQLTDDLQAIMNPSHTDHRDIKLLRQFTEDSGIEVEKIEHWNKYQESKSRLKNMQNNRTLVEAYLKETNMYK